MLLSIIAINSNAVTYDPDALAKKIVYEQHELEKKLYSQIPDTINCKQQSWMKNCETVNFLLKKHPSAPITVSTVDGVTHTFAADTPRPILNSMLNPSTETSQQVLQYKYSLDKMNSGSAQKINELINQIGTMKTPGIDIKRLIKNQTSIAGLDLSDIILTLFVSESAEYSSPALLTLKSIVEQNSSIKVQVISVGSSYSWHKNNVLDLGYKRTDLMAVTKARELGITEFPTLFTRKIGSKDESIVKDSGYLTKEEIILTIKSANLTEGKQDD